jgi:hypothetical protein
MHTRAQWQENCVNTLEEWQQTDLKASSASEVESIFPDHYRLDRLPEGPHSHRAEPIPQQWWRWWQMEATTAMMMMMMTMMASPSSDESLQQ